MRSRTLAFVAALAALAVPGVARAQTSNGVTWIAAEQTPPLPAASMRVTFGLPVPKPPANIRSNQVPTRVIVAPRLVQDFDCKMAVPTDKTLDPKIIVPPPPGESFGLVLKAPSCKKQ